MSVESTVVQPQRDELEHVGIFRDFPCHMCLTETNY